MQTSFRGRLIPVQVKNLCCTEINQFPSFANRKLRFFCHPSKTTTRQELIPGSSLRDSPIEFIWPDIGTPNWNSFRALSWFNDGPFNLLNPEPFCTTDPDCNACCKSSEWIFPRVCQLNTLIRVEDIRLIWITLSHGKTMILKTTRHQQIHSFMASMPHSFR